MLNGWRRTLLVCGATFGLLLYGQAINAGQDEPETRAAESGLWRDIKSALTASNGREYFELNMRNALVPGGTGGLHVLIGKVLSSEGLRFFV